VEIVKGLRLTVADGFTTVHNYIDTENMILRKGAVSAKKGERLLIPENETPPDLRVDYTLTFRIASRRSQ